MLSPRFSHRFAKGLIALSAGAVAAACLVACGGGGTNTANNGSGVGSGGTGSFTTGSVTGFGSIIVNGIRYDNTGVAATSQDDDTAPELKLGMVVDVEGGATSQVTKASGEVQTVAKASTIQVGFELQGPVTFNSVNTTNGTFGSLGQTVYVTVDTFFDQDSGLAGVGNVSSCPHVRVYGFPRTLGGYTASRVECLSASPSTFRVRGPVTKVMGNTVFINDGGLNKPGVGQYELDAGVPAPIMGQIVRAVARASGSGWSIVSVRGESRSLTQTRDARVEGVVSDYSATTGLLHVNGVPVKVSSGTSLDLNRPSIVAGMRVEVRGPVVNGVLNATWIEEEEDQYVYAGSGGSGGSGSPPSGGGLREIELHGNVNTLSPGTQCFYTRGVKVYFLTSGSNKTKFPSGKSASDLREGLAIEVKGVRSNSGGGAIVATEIKFSND